MNKNEDSDFSDDEVFFGKLTLKEIKKHVLMDYHQKNTLTGNDGRHFYDDYKIIQRRSQPNTLLPSLLVDVKHLTSTSDPHINKQKQIMPLETPNVMIQNSLDVEKDVPEQQPSNTSVDNLNNTLDIVDFILNHGEPHNEAEHVQSLHTKEKGLENEKSHKDKDAYLQINTVSAISATTPVTTVPVSVVPANIPIKCEENQHKALPNIKPEIPSDIKIPKCNKREIPDCFKTPKNPVSIKKDICSLKTPSRLKPYEHIASPIATYIKNCSQVPLVKNVNPKKPLPSTSSIPKLIKTAPINNLSDKENVVLPSLAYRSAKKTTVIDVNKEKLPQSPWAQKLPTSLRKPIVVKHNHRVTGGKPLMLQEDSFQNLSLHQADVSVCTEKLAFKKL